MKKIISRFTVLFAVMGMLAYCGGKQEGDAATTPSAGAVDTASNLGQTRFEEVCASCHGLSGEGDGPAGVALNPRPRNFSTEDFKFGDSFDEVKNTVQKGSEGTGMIGYESILSEEEIDAVSTYVLKLRGNN